MKTKLTLVYENQKKLLKEKYTVNPTYSFIDKEQGIFKIVSNELISPSIHCQIINGVRNKDNSVDITIVHNKILDLEDIAKLEKHNEYL